MFSGCALGLQAGRMRPLLEAARMRRAMQRGTDNTLGLRSLCSYL